MPFFFYFFIESYLNLMIQYIDHSTLNLFLSHNPDHRFDKLTHVRFTTMLAFWAAVLVGICRTSSLRCQFIDHSCLVSASFWCNQVRFDVTRFGYHFIMSFTGLFLVFFAQTVFLLLSCTHISWGIHNKSFFLGNGVRFQVVFARCSVVFLMHPFYRFFDALQSFSSFRLLRLSWACRWAIVLHCFVLDAFAWGVSWRLCVACLAMFMVCKFLFIYFQNLYWLSYFLIFVFKLN